MRIPELPRGYRIVPARVRGTGRGDERTVLALEAWGIQEVRCGFLWLRRKTVTGWTRVELADETGSIAYDSLVDTALMMNDWSERP